VALDFTLPPELGDLIDRVRAYVEEDALPAEAEIADPAHVLASWHVVERLRGRARERGLFTPHLPEAWGGLGVGPLGMALISQECGVSGLASLGLNAMAPDEGNMHTLLIAGNEEQLETYLRPLAEGRVRSCFAMTEPDVASSDPTNLETTAVREGGEWVLNGRKWCITGADGAAFAIVLTRKAFGKELARHQGLQFMLADSAMDLYASRLMVLHTAWKVEHGMPHRQEVAMTKTFVSEAFGRIADRAVQMHGAAGIAMDLPIARIFQDARAARIYDAASEVHRMVVARDMLKLAMGGESVRAACGGL
jgi:alkylation response protein AidB-like acyl-CoA dehydrogenase